MSDNFGETVHFTKSLVSGVAIYVGCGKLPVVGAPERVPDRFNAPTLLRTDWVGLGCIQFFFIPTRHTLVMPESVSAPLIDPGPTDTTSDPGLLPNSKPRDMLTSDVILNVSPTQSFRTFL